MAAHIHEHARETENQQSSWEDKAINYLQEKGVRWTPQRQLVLAALENSQGHVSVEEIYQEITRQFPRVNISTIYRTVELLAEMGLVVKVPNEIDDRERFEVVSDTLHHHLVCKNCGKETELNSQLIDELKEKTFKQYGFALQINHFMGYGLCNECRQEADLD